MHRLNCHKLLMFEQCSNTSPSSQLDVLRPMVVAIVDQLVAVLMVLLIVSMVWQPPVRSLCSTLRPAVKASDDSLLVVQLRVLRPFDVYNENKMERKR